MTTTYLYTLPNNTTNMNQIVVDTISVIPELSPLILFLVFCIVAIGGISRQRWKTGRADSILWLTLASISTLIVTLIMSVVAGVINLLTLSIVISLTILFGVWFFLDRKASEI